jgi:DNA topoisomerase-1
MEKALVIVESPAKARTINRYLGPGYSVMASLGHVRDLPKNRLGVDLERDFRPEYIVIPERRKIVGELKKAAENAGLVILAADPDREGEAICWHLSDLLSEAQRPIHRAILHEITKRAVEDAIRGRQHLDPNKYNAQQTRRILDRLVGYLISPLLWKKIGKGLSAGRVQSIALRLIVEREREIRAFVPEEYWTIFAHLNAAAPPTFKATLTKIDGKKAKIENGAAARAIIDELKGAAFILQDVLVEEKRKYPPPPYTTSTLQQDAFRFLRFPVKRTMFIAQKLYEGLPIGERGLVGLITYMRTDSVRISAEAQDWARRSIEERFSSRHVPARPPVYKNKSQAQDAHEAIRPTTPELNPEAVKPYLKAEEFALYELIWKRFLASQMSPAVVEETVFEIAASRALFTAKGEVLKFDGFWALYPSRENGEKENLPLAKAGETLSLANLESKQNFTQPPPRYTEGSLVKELEAKGIGRPSTYAPTIATLQDRTYVFKSQGKFTPTDLGMFVTDFLVQNFPDLLDVKFTAGMEEELDRIEEGELDWVGSLRSFYQKLDKDLKNGAKTESVKATGIPLEEKCPECGQPLVIKDGRFGLFKACSGYPGCKFKENLVRKETVPLEERCPECGSALVQRRGRFGPFVSCSTYPKCKYIKKEHPEDTGIACPKACGGTILKRKTRRAKFFYGCSAFPRCRFATWDEPLREPCPKCGKPFVLRKSTKRDGTYLHCADEACGWREPRKKGDPSLISETIQSEGDGFRGNK